MGRSTLSTASPRGQISFDQVSKRTLGLTAALLGTVGLLVLGASTASASVEQVYAFKLIGTDTAVAPTAGTMAGAGDWIAVTGKGVFDPSAGWVHARGTFVHHRADGSIHCQGTWTATAFDSFLAFDGRDDATSNARNARREGDLGGVLKLTVTHRCSMTGMTMTGIPMTVTSTINAPIGSAFAEGVTVCDFTVPTGGRVEIDSD